MGFTRRDLLKFTGGAAAGLVFTPVPWRTLRDASRLSQNWPGVPEPPRGEITTRYTTCTLCPAGCGVRARCVAGRPVSLAGVAGHPSGGVTLCAFGLTGHHLPFCGGRATQPLAYGRAVQIDEVIARVADAVARCAQGESVAILDARPGRTASQIYRRFLAGTGNGIHCAPPEAQPYGPFGIDLENTRAVLSLGVPVLDGWLSPGRVLSNRSRFKLLQVESGYSRTASLADEWIQVPSGAEASFAAAVARALKGQSADRSAEETARLLAANRPAIAIGPGAGKLNEILGSVGRAGGFLQRREEPPAIDLAAVPDHSIRVLLAEEASLPWSLIERKLVRRDAVVAALTPWLDGYARQADYVIPVPLYLEALDEGPAPAGATVAGFSLSAPLVAAPPGLVQPAEFVLRLGRTSESYADSLKQRVTALQHGGRGKVFSYANARWTPVRDIASAGDLWKALLDGGAWCDDPLPQPAAALPVLAADSGRTSLRRTPLMSKLDQESGLRGRV